jgi:hypothetical protein
MVIDAFGWTIGCKPGIFKKIQVSEFLWCANSVAIVPFTLIEETPQDRA